MREREPGFREREKETWEKERETREREKGVRRLDMARYTPVALDEDGERELRELKVLSSFIFCFDDHYLVISSHVIVDPSSCHCQPVLV